MATTVTDSTRMLARVPAAAMGQAVLADAVLDDAGPADEESAPLPLEAAAVPSGQVGTPGSPAAAGGAMLLVAVLPVADGLALAELLAKPGVGVLEVVGNR